MASLVSGLIEPLGESAPLAWAEAPRLCPRDDVTDETCRWYHQVWQYLRLLGVISTVGTNSGFLAQTFRMYARTGAYRRVFIAGSADYAMLARLKDAYDSERQPVDITVLDRCATSLLLNRWYADWAGFAISAVRADALEFRVEPSVDLVCTHNFLGRFDRVGRERLVQAWHASLRPGGVVVTSLRIRPGSRDTYVVYSDDQARTFAAKVAAAAHAYGGALDVGADDLEAAAYEYAKRKKSFVITSNHEVTDVFERHGFDVVLADQGGGRAERDRDRPASLAGTDTYRMRLIAVKR